jgi:phosphate transport system ATP-binding protein
VESKTKISTRNLNLYYGENHALKNINLDLYEHKITAFIGPSGCGKSTYLKTLNRMNDLVPGVKIDGTVLLDDEDIYDSQVDTTLLRKKIGMVFQQPNPFPMSIYDNIAYGPRIHGIKNKAQLDEIVENSLKGAALWDEVSDRLKKSALGLSGGQQQRLCIARALLKKPRILILDDSTSAVDTATDARIREAFGAAIPGTTKIIIAQRISSVQHADHILVIEDGRINGYGTHDQLVRSNEIYREIYESQSRGGGDFDQVRTQNSGKESVA